MKSIAVIIPCYNCSSTLERAIKSVLNQSVVADEIIVVDDCSRNGNVIVEICNKYDKVNFIRNNENLGLAGSRNVGVKCSSSEIVSFLDADDQYHYKKIEIQLPFLDINSAVSTDCISLREGAEKSKIDIPEVIPFKKYTSPYQNLLFNRLVGASLMIKTDTLKKIGGYDSDLRSVEDFELWLRLLSNNITVYAVSLPLYLYYDTDHSLSKDKATIWKNMSNVVDKFMKNNDLKNKLLIQCLWFILLAKEQVRAEILMDDDLKSLLKLNFSQYIGKTFCGYLFLILIRLKLFKLLSMVYRYSEK